MKPQTFIFIGRSGCGKGTQAVMLIDAMKLVDPTHDSLYIETGAELRQFIQGTSHTQKIAKAIYDAGKLAPEFISVYQWVKVLIERYTRNEHLIFDGTPRKVHEAGVLNSIIGFYKLEKPWVVNIEIGKDEAVRRLMLRKRQDDTEADIQERLSWFETEVVPVIDFYRGNPGYNFFRIDGERSPEEIHGEIVKKVGMTNKE